MAVDLNYGIGVEGKNLVLKTLGRVYVKVKDRKYELAFRPEDIKRILEENTTETEETDTSDVLFLISKDDLQAIEYPGDNKLIVTQDGYFYYTQNQGYTQIPLSFSGSNLTLDTLTVTGQIIFTGSQAVFVIPNTQLITNLNADLLDGYHADSFGIKNRNESISGNWNFTNQLTFNTGIGNTVLSDPDSQRIIIDFKQGKITCNTIEANNIITSEEEADFSDISGIGSEVWVGAEVNVTSFSSTAVNEFNNFSLVQQAYNNNELPHASSENGQLWDLEDFWYDQIFFDSWNTDNSTYVLKDFNNPDTWNSVNAKFNGTAYNLSLYQNLINALTTVDHSEFTGTTLIVNISNNVPIMSVITNMIFKDDVGNIGCILERTNNRLIVRMLNSASYFSGKKMIIIGSLVNRAGICLSAKNPSIAILENCLDLNSANVYFGELSKIDSSKSGIGMILSGNYPSNVVADNTLSNIQNYQHTASINIENPYIKWGNNIVTLNEDGSGLISQGQIRWSAHKDLVIDSANILNTTISNGTLQNGNATNLTVNNSSVINSTLLNCSLDCDSDIPDCLLNNRTYDNITLKNSTIDTTNLITGVPTQSNFDDLLNALKLRDSKLTREISSNSYDIDPWIHSWAVCDDYRDGQSLMITFNDTSPYSQYFSKRNTFSFRITIPDYNLNVYFYNGATGSWNGQRVSNLTSADLNGNSIENGSLVLNFGRGGGTTGYQYMLFCIIDWDTPRIHVIIC